MENPSPQCGAAAEDPENPEVFCLMRVNNSSGWLRLWENCEITVGRGMDVTYPIISLTYPLMLSRLHCSFKLREDGAWTVTDRKSLNGVWVNGRQITPEKPHVIRLGDSIQLGVAVKDSVEFDYEFVKRPLNDVRSSLLRPDMEAPNHPRLFKKPKRKMTDEIEPSTSSKPKLYRSSGVDKSTAQPCPIQTIEPLEPREPRPENKVQHPIPNVKNREDVDNLQMFSQNNLMLREQVDCTERRVASLEGQPQQSAPYREEQREWQRQLDTLRAKMEEMKALELSFNNAKQQLEEQKRKTRRDQMKEEKKQEREQQQEVHLKQKLDEALKEQKKVLDELSRSRRGFEEMLLAKNKELEVTKEEKEKAKAKGEEVVSQMTEVMQNELECIICSEFFIEAVNLNCAHSFCKYCIQQWRKKKDQCPICSQAIVSQTRCLALDNCIDSMVENLSLELKRRRQELVNERKGAPPAEVMVILDDDCSASGAPPAEVMVIQDDDSSALGDAEGPVLVASSASSSVQSVDSDSDSYVDYSQSAPLTFSDSSLSDD
ncbi:unnamed protein product [Knipowitschia caucasica]